MTEKRFTDVWCSEIGHIGITDNGIDKEFTGSEFEDFLNELSDENEQLKIALKDKENLINICEKKFKELGYLITCDDNGYVIE